MSLLGGNHLIPSELLPSGHPPAWTPLELGSLLHSWHNPESLAILGNAALIDTYQDESENAYHLTQAGAARPAVYLDVRNGLPVVRFDGATQYLAYPAAGYLNPQTSSIVATAAVYTTDGTSTIIGQDEITESFSFRPDNGAGAPSIFIRDGAEVATAANAALNPATLPPVVNRGLGAMFRGAAPFGAANYHGGDLGDVVTSASILSGRHLALVERFALGRYG